MTWFWGTDHKFESDATAHYFPIVMNGHGAGPICSEKTDRGIPWFLPRDIGVVPLCEKCKAKLVEPEPRTFFLSKEHTTKTRKRAR